MASSDWRIVDGVCVDADGVPVRFDTPKPPPPDPGIWHCCGKGHIEGHDPKCPATTWRGWEPLMIFAAAIGVLLVIVIGALA